MRVISVLMLMAWAWGAGGVYAVGGAEAKFCNDESLAIDPITPFAWQLAVVAITFDGGWGKNEAACQ